MLLFFTQIQRLKFKLGLDRKVFVLSFIKKLKPMSILEIGVFNANFTSRMLTEVQKYNREFTYTGVDLFALNFDTVLKKEEVSLWPSDIESIKLKLASFKNANIQLLSGNSKEVLPKLKKNNKFDLIVIDGGHSFDTVKSDWLNCLQLLSNEGIIIFDDYTNSRGDLKGGFGIRKLVKEIKLSNKGAFQIKFSKNRDFFWKDYGLLILQMVMIRRAERT
jgi:hypothetical protein